MPNDLYSVVLYNDGEGLDHNDLNNTSRATLARLTDAMLERMTGYLGVADKDPHIAGESGANPGNTSLAFTMTGGCCVAAQGSTGTRIKLLPGTLFQKTGTAAGTESTFIPFQVAASDVDLVIGAGDATNPRIDILQVKLEWESGASESRDFEDATTRAKSTTTPNKKRRVLATFSIKAGTAAATPTYPAPDTGYCMVAAVRVPATWTTGVSTSWTNSATSAIIRQCSVPLNIQHHQSMAHEWDTILATNWTRNADGSMGANGGAATNLICPAPQGSSGKRIVGVAVTGVWVTSGVVELKTVTWNAFTGYTTASHPNFDLSSYLVTTGGTTRMQMAHLGEIADSSPDSNPSAANGVVGDPYWVGGGLSGPAQMPWDTDGEGSGSSNFSRAMLLIDAGSGSSIICVDWWLAG